MKYLLFPLLFMSFVDKRFGLRIITSFTLGMFYSEMISYLIHFEIIPYRYSYLGYEIYEASAQNDPTPFLDHSRYTVLLSISISLLLYNILDFKFNLLFKAFVTFFYFYCIYKFNFNRWKNRIYKFFYFSFICIVLKI